MKEQIDQLFGLVAELRERVEQLEQAIDDMRDRTHSLELKNHRPDCRCADCEG